MKEKILNSVFYVPLDKIVFIQDDNYTDFEKVDIYYKKIKFNDENYGNHNFEPIEGYFFRVDKQTIKNQENINTIIDENKHIDLKVGDVVFGVTDGNHRAIAHKKHGTYKINCLIERQYAHTQKTYLLDLFDNEIYYK